MALNHGEKLVAVNYRISAQAQMSTARHLKLPVFSAAVGTIVCLLAFKEWCHKGLNRKKWEWREKRNRDAFANRDTIFKDITRAKLPG